MIECPNCEKTSSGSSCRFCGWSAVVTVNPKPAEGYAPWQAPTYAEPNPGDDALIRAEIARVKAILGMSLESKARRAGLPDVDPEIREKLSAPR